jgi:hypothetical protein
MSPRALPVGSNRWATGSSWWVAMVASTRTASLLAPGPAQPTSHGRGRQPDTLRHSAMPEPLGRCQQGHSDGLGAVRTPGVAACRDQYVSALAGPAPDTTWGVGLGVPGRDPQVPRSGVTPRAKPAIAPSVGAGQGAGVEAGGSHRGVVDQQHRWAPHHCDRRQRRRAGRVRVARCPNEPAKPPTDRRTRSQGRRHREHRSCPPAVTPQAPPILIQHGAQQLPEVARWRRRFGLRRSCQVSSLVLAR